MLTARIQLRPWRFKDVFCHWYKIYAYHYQKNRDLVGGYIVELQKLPQNIKIMPVLVTATNLVTLQPTTATRIYNIMAVI